MQTIYYDLRNIKGQQREVEEKISAAAKILREGGLVGIPTETVYGLGANGLDSEAVNRIFQAKGRPQDNPLILHLSGAQWLPRYCADIPPIAYVLARKFWPGPLTMILKRKPIVPDETTAGLDTVGVRCPNHPVTLAIIREAGVPIAAPSANASGRPSCTSAQDVLEADAYMTQLEEKLGLEKNTVGLMPLIETALGVENSFAIASATKRVKALFLGAEDLTADLQCVRTKEGREIEYARTRLVVAARAAGVAVYDTPFTDVNDDEGIVKDATYAKALGFNGKASISPRHVEVINSVFSPTQKEVDYAYEVMEAIALAKAQGKGAIALHGKMIDAPIVARAEQTIAMAQALGRDRGV